MSKTIDWKEIVVGEINRIDTSLATNNALLDNRELPWLQFTEWLEGMSFREIARNYGCSKSTVSARVQKIVPQFIKLCFDQNDMGVLVKISEEQIEKLENYDCDADVINDVIDEITFDDDSHYYDDEDFDTSGMYQEVVDELEDEIDDTPYTAIVTDESIAIIVSDGRQYSVHSGSESYENVKELVMKAALLEEVIQATNVARAVMKRLNKIEYRDGQLFYEDIPVSCGMIPRIMQTDEIGETGYTKALENMFGRLIENPSRRVVDQLYKFLETNQLPITPDGCFLAYKRVNADHTDCYTGKIDNSVGNVVKMVRNMVNDDPQHTCSAGLHVCSEEYLGHFGGSNIMVCKIDPADVVAVPYDYNGSKMRVCMYEVVGQIGEGFSHEDMKSYFHNTL